MLRLYGKFLSWLPLSHEDITSNCTKVLAFPFLEFSSKMI